MKVLGIDYGDARLGVAASDALGLVARPLETIHRHACPKPEMRILELVASEQASTVVLGLPYHLDGSEGKAAAKVRAFAARLRSVLPAAVALVFCDERLSTVEAQARLRRGGKPGRGAKSLIDQTAAAVILQDWLDQRAGPVELPPPD